MALNHLNACPTLVSGLSGDCSCDKEVGHYLKLAKISFSLFMLEFLGGLFSGSMALVSDALHVLMDGTENMISVFVSRLSKKGNEQRVRMIGAKISAYFLFCIAGGIIYEGWSRLFDPHPVKWYMIIIAIIGLVINIYQRVIHQKAHAEHRNVTHFWQDMHLLSDIATSVAVIMGGVIMLVAGGWYWIDGMLSMGIGALIMIFTGARILEIKLHSHYHHDHEHKHEEGECRHRH
ncbi:MAG: cation transporter [Candidatus Yonathbacteria bacterium]|nr:cation transporter [Candidatus Yonathbacteria bacterium]